MYSYFMCLFSEAGILFVGSDKQLDLTEIGKSQLVHPPYSQQHSGVILCCTMVKKMVLMKLHKNTLQRAANIIAKLLSQS